MAEASGSQLEQQTLPDIQPPSGPSKVAYFPAPAESVAPIANVAATQPVAPVAATEPLTPATPAPAAAPGASAASTPPGKAAAPAKGGGTSALTLVKGRRGLMAGLGVAAIVVIAFLVARPAPPVETAPVNSKPQAARPKPSAVPQAEDALDAKWSVNSKRWGANQKKSIAVELSALNRVQVWMRQVQPMLVVRCVAKTTEAFVFTESAIAMEPNTPDHTVRFTFDDGPQKSEQWPDSVEHDSLFAPDGAAFARRLLTARTLQFGFTPHNAPAVVAQFQLNGLRELLEPAAKDCGWQ